MKTILDRRMALLLTALLAAGMFLLISTVAAQGRGAEPSPLLTQPANTSDAEPGLLASEDSRLQDEAIRLQEEIEASVRQDLLRRMADTSMPNDVGTVSNVQENGRRVEGLVSVGGYSVTVTLKDPWGVAKSVQTTWPDGSLHYQVNMTATIQPSDTVEVAAGGITSVIFVDPMGAELDPANDRVLGTGPANESLDLQLYIYDEGVMTYETFTATANVDAGGAFTASTFYKDGTPQTVDIQPGDYGEVRYTHADGNEVYLNFGQVVYVHQNHNKVHGYAAMNSVPVSVTLYASGGSIKAQASTTSSDWGAGEYSVSFYTDPWSGGDPMPIRGGDEVVVTIQGVSTTVPVDLLTATPNLATDTVSGVGPANSNLKVTLSSCYDQSTNQPCHEWVTTDSAGTYTAGPFLYSTWGYSGTVTRTYDIQTGDTGEVEYINPDYNVIYINYAATGVATTIAGGGLRVGATAVLGTAMPGATVEIWDVTDNALIGTGTADADARFAISVSPPLIYGHTIVAIADGLPSVGHVVQRAVTINGPAVSVSNTVGFYGIAPADSTIEVYASGTPAAIVTTTTSAGGHWSAVTILANGTHTVTVTAVEPDQTSDQIVVIVDPTAVSIGGSSAIAGGVSYESEVSGQNHFQVVGSVQPLTITVEVLNHPCTVTIGFMGQTFTATAGTTPTPETTFTAVFTNYDWDWGTHEVVVTAVSCGGTPISQPVAEVTLIDPSGYVYDTFTAEKIQGATVTCYFSDTVQGQWIIWEAALYNNQLNSQLTDTDGWYGFMVPPGNYYVVASKEGYEDNQTVVYTIPPEVTDAHIPLTPLGGDPANVTLVAKPDNISIGGATSTLTATVTDEFDAPVTDGTVITFTTNLGNLGSSLISRMTVNGVATATLTSGDITGTATVTATAGTAFDTVAVEFTPLPCPIPVDGVSITGPVAGDVNVTYTFTATVSPPNATIPITYVWKATGQSSITQTKPFTQFTASFAWAISATQAVTITAENCGGTYTANHNISIKTPPWYVYLPVITRESP